MNIEPNTKSFFEENVDSSLAKVEHHLFLLTKKRKKNISERLSLSFKGRIGGLPNILKISILRNILKKLVRC